MKRIGYLLYQDVDNPQEIPGEWVAEMRVLNPGEMPDAPWHIATETEYEAYRASKYPLFLEWQRLQELEEERAKHIEVLWAECYAYNFRYFSGGIYAQMLEMKLAGIPALTTMVVDIQDWIQNLWVGDYYVRKYQLQTATTIEQIHAVSIDFSNHGQPPWTVQQMLAMLPQ